MNSLKLKSYGAFDYCTQVGYNKTKQLFDMGFLGAAKAKVLLCASHIVRRIWRNTSVVNNL